MSPLWMPLYVGDYIGGTMHLSTVEHGAYLLLIMHYWQKGSLPTEDRNLASVAKLPLDEWLEIMPTIAAFFEEGWKHKRVEVELANAKQISSKRSASGKRAAYARYNKRMPSAEQTNYQTHAQLQSQEKEDIKPPLPEVRRDQVSPSDPVLQRPDDPLAAYSETELKALAFEFDGIDVESAICDLAHWARKRGITDPIEWKSAIYGALRKRYAKAKLHDAMQSPEPATVSPQLAASKLVRRTMDDAGPFPESLRRRKQHGEAA